MFKMLTNNQDEESKAAENLEVAGGICWRQKWRIVLCLTGEIFNCFPMKVILATGKVKESAVNVFSSKIEIFLRDLDLAFHRPFGFAGLCGPGHCLLQQ